MTNAHSRLGCAILGATGYAGAELVRLLGAHPHATLKLATSRRWAGKTIGAALPGLGPSAPGAHLLLQADAGDVAQARQDGIDVVFACLPHGQFLAQAEAWLAAGVRVVDVSADYRLRRPEDYRRHYQFEHTAPNRLAEAVYGLGGWSARGITSKTQLVANPGCYATAILLGCLPAAEAGWLKDAPIVVNALSGASGAGRAPQLTTLLGECGNSVAPYKVGERHPHLGEIDQALRASGCTSRMVFNPHLLPMARGILASLALPLRHAKSQNEAQALYTQRYDDNEEIVVLDESRLPETRFVRGTNRCDIAVRLVDEGRMLMVFTAIDNLLKGAAGQAIENFNRMYGFAPQCGLPQGASACG